MWVDQAMPLVRGLVQGFPKKLGSIWMTRPVTVGKAGPRLEPGGRFGASLAANDRRLAEATLTLTGTLRGRPDRQLAAALQHAPLPGLGDGRRAAPRARLGGRRRPRDLADLGGRRDACASSSRPADELAELAPVEVGKGFWFSFGYTVSGGQARQ